MQIGLAAAASGISAKKIRHYESIGLVPGADRRDNTYREYSEADVHRFQFIRRARDLGFSFDQIRDLLRLWSDRARSNTEVKAIAVAHLAELEHKILLLADMAATLRELAGGCDGSGRPECPILRGLAGAIEASTNADAISGQLAKSARRLAAQRAESDSAPP